MKIPNIDHLIEQAELLADAYGRVRRQAALRRSISTAYYALFHFTLWRVADEFVGATQRQSSRYALVYRAVDHRTLRDTCMDALKPAVGQQYRPYVPAGDVGSDLKSFASAIVELKSRRLCADYDPRSRVTIQDAVLAIHLARGASEGFPKADQQHQRAFLTLLLSPPR